MNYLAIVGWGQNNQVTKFQPYAEKADADAHVASHGGFVAPMPTEDWPHWLVDPVTETLSVVLRPSPTPAPAPLSPEELYDVLELKGFITDTDRPRPKA